MADQTYMQVSLQIVKILAYICTFLFVLGGAVLSKGTLLFMTSQLQKNRTIGFCNEPLNGNHELSLPLSYFLGPHGLSKI
jgi:chitin synthase